MPTPTVFISYAREDDSHRAELRKHLRPWTDDGRLRLWDDRAIDAGAEWEPEILQALDDAAVVVFLVSADLLDSRFIHEVELPRALERRQRGDATVIPVIVRACSWSETALGKLQALRSGEPVPKEDPDPAWTEIAQAIAAAAAGWMVEEPEPDYPDERTRDLSLTLADAYRREEELITCGGDPAAVRREILEIKRELREDGLFPGDLLSGRYSLLEPIGQGGFAKVWKAWDRQMRHLVATKVLHHQYVRDRTRRQRFFRGARQMARLVHPGIVRILGDPERSDGSARYFVMEYVDGGDLRRTVLNGSLGIEDRLRIVCEVGVALEYAHNQGVIHRDVKPANVLLDTAGRAKLTDFDLVRALDSTGGTRTGMLGTVVYAAPEAMEQAKEAGAAADVFGLGMTAVFVLHGTDLPAREVLRDAPAFALRLAAPASVCDALARAIAWEPEERQGSVAELCAALVLPKSWKPPGSEDLRHESLGSPGAVTVTGSARPTAPRYEDFALNIEEDGRGSFRARILESPYGSGRSAVCHLPYPPDKLTRLLEELEATLQGNFPSSALSDDRLNLEAATSPRDPMPAAVGARLFEALFQGEVLDRLRASLDRVAERPEIGLRIRITLDPRQPRLVPWTAIPWELLYRSETQDFLSLDLRTPVVRNLVVPHSPVPWPDRLRILVVAPQPRQALDRRLESQRLAAFWEHAAIIEVRHLERATRRELQRALQKEVIHALHFIGHGDFHPATGEGVLFFEEERGDVQPTTGTMLADTLETSSRLCFVVLSASESSLLLRRGGINPFGSVASALVMAGVPAVVAHQFRISDHATITFNDAFYRALAQGETVDVAVAQGRMAMFQEWPTGWEWSTPAIYTGG